MCCRSCCPLRAGAQSSSLCVLQWHGSCMWARGRSCPIGLHGDGVPFDSQRTRSLELLRLNFPATGSPLRVPVVGVPKEFFVEGKTYQALLELLAWSLRWCAMGQHPPALPDGTPFVDKQAAALAGQPLGCRAALLEVRADWQFLKICFGFPAWNEKAGCCWLCEATPGASIRQTGPDACGEGNDWTACRRCCE